MAVVRIKKNRVRSSYQHAKRRVVGESLNEFIRKNPKCLSKEKPAKGALIRQILILFFLNKMVREKKQREGCGEVLSLLHRFTRRT